MSWTKRIAEAIDRKLPETEIKELLGAATESIGAKLQGVVNDTAPEDYPFLLALLNITAREFAKVLSPKQCLLAALYEMRIETVTMVLPQQKSGDP